MRHFIWVWPIQKNLADVLCVQINPSNHLYFISYKIELKGVKTHAPRIVTFMFEYHGASSKGSGCFRSNITARMGSVHFVGWPWHCHVLWTAPVGVILSAITNLIIISKPTELPHECLREHIGSVIECLTRDRGAAGLSLTASLCCVLQQDTFILA